MKKDTRDFPIRKIDSVLWQKFKKCLLDEVDPETYKPISANAKIKELIAAFVRMKEAEKGEIDISKICGPGRCSSIPQGLLTTNP